MVFNSTFNNISVISWCSVSLVEETGEKHQLVASLCQALSLCYVELTSPWTEFKLPTLVVIGTDCIGIWIYNSQMIRISGGKFWERTWKWKCQVLHKHVHVTSASSLYLFDWNWNLIHKASVNLSVKFLLKNGIHEASIDVPVEQVLSVGNHFFSNTRHFG